MANVVWWKRYPLKALGARSNVESLFELEPRWRLLLAPLERLLAFSPRVEIIEHDDAHVLVFDVPGIRKEDLDIRVDDHHILTISGERREPRARRSRARYNERRYGVFSRSIELPHTVDASKMEVGLHDGVLEVHVPKLEASRGRVVPIGSREVIGRDRADAPRQPSITS
jgi:HSP20 family molecular chaperone IbpA